MAILKNRDKKPLTLKVTAMESLRIVLYDYALPNSILSTTKYFTILKVRTNGIWFFLHFGYPYILRICSKSPNRLSKAK